MVPTSDRAAVGALLTGLGGTIDLLIPRGGRSLVERVQAEARVPVLGHLEGICHTYVQHAADVAMASAIVRNAKLRRVSVCGSTETLLIDRAALPMLPTIAEALQGCELRGDAEAAAIVPMPPAQAEDWDTEYLAPILSIRTVSDLDRSRSPISPAWHRTHRGDRHRRRRRSRSLSRPRSIARSCCGTPRPSSPTAASSASAPKSALQRESFMPAARSVPSSSPASNMWFAGAGRCGLELARGTFDVVTHT